MGTERRRAGWRTVVSLAVSALLAMPMVALAASAAGEIDTIAGTGAAGYAGDGGPAPSAQLHAPAGVALDASGKTVYVPDAGNHVVRRIDADGTITTVAGTGAAGYSGDGGAATAAELDRPGAVTLGQSGELFVADAGNHVVRRIDADGTITTVAGTGTAGFRSGATATKTPLNSPGGLAYDGPGKRLFIADTGNHVVRTVDKQGRITTVAGRGTAGYAGDGGPATAAQLSEPLGLAYGHGATTGSLLVADAGNHVVRALDDQGIISTVAGTGVAGYDGDGGAATSALLHRPAGVAWDGPRGRILVADAGNHTIRFVDRDGAISTLAGRGQPGYEGDGGPGQSALLNGPTGVAVQNAGLEMILADTGNHVIRSLTLRGLLPAPTLSGVTPDSPANDNEPRVLGEAPIGTSVTLHHDDACSGAVASGTAAELADGGIPVSVPDDSTTTFWAAAHDALGNTSACSSTSVTYVEDSTPPAAPRITDAPDSPGRDRRPTWRFTTERDATAVCQLLYGRDIVAGWSSCDAEVTYDLDGRPDGVYRFEVYAVDPAGNEGAVAASRYTLDTTEAPDTGDSGDADDDPTTGGDGEDDDATTGGDDEDDDATTGGPGEDDDGSGSSAAPESTDDASTETPASGPATAPSAPADASMPAPTSPPPAETESAGGPSLRPSPDRPTGTESALAPGVDPGELVALARGVLAAPTEAPAVPTSVTAGPAGWRRAQLATTDVAEKAAFPILLLLVMAAFLVIQHHLDRKDPKLALAPVHADRDVPFLHRRGELPS